MVKHISCITVPSNLTHLLHKDFLYPSSSSSSVTISVSTAGPNKSMKNGVIQKSSVLCYVVASETGGLLFAPRYSGSFVY